MAEFLGDVDEGGRRLYFGRDIEAESLGLTGFVVGVLSEDDDLHLVKGRAVEGCEDFAGGRVAGAVAVGGADEIRQLDEIGLLEFLVENGFPRGFDFDFHRGYSNILAPSRDVILI